MDLELAILEVLARSPDRPITFAEIGREFAHATSTPGLVDRVKRSSTRHVRRGLVTWSGDGLQITTAGLALLSQQGNASSTVSKRGSLKDVPAESAVPSLGPIDDVLTPAERAKIFELDLRPKGDEFRSSSDPQGNVPLVSQHMREEHIAHRPDPGFYEEAPSLREPTFGSKIRGSFRGSSAIAAHIAAKARSLTAALQRGGVVTARAPKNIELPRGKKRSAAFVLLGLASAIAFAAAVVGAGQINSLKTEVAALQRESLTLRERVTALERFNRANREPEPKSDFDGEKVKALASGRSDQSGLSLSQEEIQMIKTVIIPAPVVDPSAPAIKPGDNITGAVIPLPSQLVDKIPKLLGAKFTTRNGAIVIVGRDSHKADLVLAPN